MCAPRGRAFPICSIFRVILASGRSRHGHGEIHYDSGATYVGGWARGKRSGHGTMLYAGGDVYIGQWRRDMKHGRGTLRFAAGGVYQGAFRVGEVVEWWMSVPGFCGS